MVKLVFVYPPFCTPVSPPYSVTNLYSKFKANSDVGVSALDLNVEFHNLFFKDFKSYFQSKDWRDYDEKSKSCVSVFKEAYRRSHSLILSNEEPEGFDYLLGLVLKEKPDFVAFSIVYSSQVFYAYSLIKKLKSLGVKTVVGGPCVSSKVRSVADFFFEDEDSLLDFFGVVPSNDFFVDFSVFDSGKYFSPGLVLPLKTSSTCFYKGCAFCSHFSNKKYVEFDLGFIERTVSNNDSDLFFLVDDMIPSQRLLDLAKIFKRHNVSWGCQLKPTKDFSREVLQELRGSGLKFVLWGVESGSNRVLKAMKKNTNKEDMALILKNSKESGVFNVVYVLFGFPSETRSEFLETIDFLKQNKDYVDLVSSAVFGLQKGSKVYADPEKYCVTNIFEEERTFLEPKVSYSVSNGLSAEKAFALRKSHLKFLASINKVPSRLNFFREHVFFY